MVQNTDRAPELVVCRDEVREIILKALAEPDIAAVKLIVAILASFKAEDDRKELEADLQHLRRWRKAVEQAQSLTFKAAITVIVTGFLCAVWMGVKAALGK